MDNLPTGYAYSFEEVAVDGYASSVTTAGDGATVITNTKLPDKTDLTVVKQWLDSAGNTLTSGLPGPVTINLYQRAAQSGSSGGGESESGGETEISYIAKCNDGTKTGTFSDVAIGDTVMISVEYTWQASLYNVKPSDWAGVSAGTEEYSNDGYTYDYTCRIMSSSISFDTGDQKASIEEIRCTLIEKGTTSNSGSSGNAGNSEQIVSEGTQFDSITLDASNSWTHTFTNLPLSGTDAGGNAVTYTYYVKEVSVPGYDTTYTNNGGIPSGTITVTNTKEEGPETTPSPSYELPETGSTGTLKVTLGGALLVAVSLLYGVNQRRRREGRVRP